MVSEDEDQRARQDAVVARVLAIDEQPLEQRAAVYGELYEELRTRLEGSDSPRYPA